MQKDINENIDFEKLAQDNEKILELYKENLSLKQDNVELQEKNENLQKKYGDVSWKLQRQSEDIHDNQEKRDAKWFGGSVGVVLVSAFIAFCVGSCCNGCAANEDHKINGDLHNGYRCEVVHSIESGMGEDAYYRLEENVVLVDKKGKYNIGDTIVFSKK